MALIAVAFVVLLVLFIDEGGGEDAPEVTVGFTTPVETDLQEELAQRFRPLLFFDSDESWRPLEIGAFLRESEAGGPAGHRLCSPPKGQPGAPRSRHPGVTGGGAQGRDYPDVRGGGRQS